MAGWYDGRVNRFAPTSLMLGNIVTGCSVLAPAGMLADLSEGLDVSISTAGLLITFGAVMLCVASPVTAWLTGRIERRWLLSVTLAVLALSNAASAFAPDYSTLLILRLVMLGVGALYTPQAAGTAALIVPTEKRGSSIAYVFLGWSLAAALGLPLITFVAHHYGFRAAYGGIAVTGCISCLLLLWQLPRGLRGVPVELKTWAELGRNRLILMLLAITTLQMSGQFVVFTFMGPLLTKLTGAGANAIGLAFALYGVCGFVGIVVATRIVDFLGSLPHLGAVHLDPARRDNRMGAGRGPLCRHGRLGGGLGPRLCFDQLDAAGAAGRCRARTRIRVGLTQHVRALYRAGGRLRHRRHALRARVAARRGLCRSRLRRGGIDHGRIDQAASGGQLTSSTAKAPSQSWSMPGSPPS